MFFDSDPCSVFFLTPCRRFFLHTFQGIRILVAFEGRSAMIDIEPKPLVSRLIALAVSCFGLTVAEGHFYLGLDPRRLALYNLEDELTSQIVVLKRADPWAAELTFSGRISAAIPSFQLSLLANLLCGPPLKTLLAVIRQCRNADLDFARLTEDRLAELMPKFASDAAHIGAAASAEELNSLLFLLFGSSPTPLVSPALHQMALQIIAERPPARQYERLAVFALFLPLETHAILSELALTYHALSPVGWKRLIQASTATLFPTPIDRPAEQEFTGLMLLCAQWLLGLPPKAGKEVRASGERLVVVDGGVVRAWDGPVEVRVEDTEPFELPTDMEAEVTRFVSPPPTDTNEVAHGIRELSRRTLAAKRALRIRRRSSTSLTQAFDRLFT
jgi:hypothetical protein